MTIVLGWFCWILWVLGGSLFYQYLDTIRVDQQTNPDKYIGRMRLTNKRMVVLAIIWWVVILSETFGYVFLSNKE